MPINPLILLQHLLFAVLLCFVLLLNGCKSIKLAVSETTNQERTTESVETKTDSIYIYRQDSVVVRIRSDTVFVDRWRSLYRYRNITDTLLLRDSLYIDRHVNVTETVEVNRPTGWQWFQIYCGRILLLILLSGIACTAYKLLIKK